MFLHLTYFEYEFVIWHWLIRDLPLTLKYYTSERSSMFLFLIIELAQYEQLQLFLKAKILILLSLEWMALHHSLSEDISRSIKNILASCNSLKKHCSSDNNSIQTMINALVQNRKWPLKCSLKKCNVTREVNIVRTYQ